MALNNTNETGFGGGAGPPDELVLLDRVFMRLATAQTDEELTSAVGKYLSSCLLKLSSPQEGVRKKVLELLVHINKRVKGNNNIQLPVDSLLVQYQDPSATSFVTNFTIIYIKMGFPRMPLNKQALLVPAVLSSLQGKPESHQDSLLLMIMPIMAEVMAPTDDPAKKLNYLGLSERPGVAKTFHAFLLDYLLLPYGSHPSISSEPKEKGSKTLNVPAAMSEHAWKRVAGDTVLPSEVLEKRKCSIVKFLGTGLLPDMDIALPLLISTSDSRHSVATEADTVQRKFAGFIDWEDANLIGKVYAMFLGTLVIKDKQGQPTSGAVKLEHRRTPANTRIRLKLMPRLLNSREAAMQFPACIQVTFDLLFGTTGNSNAKLKTMAVQFIHHIIEHCPENRLSAIGAVLLSALSRLVSGGASSGLSSENTKNGSSNVKSDDEQKQNEASQTNASKENIAKLRASCYIAIGKLGLKVPSLVNKDISMIQTFFEAMSTEDKERQISVQESLSLMAPSFKQMDSSNLNVLEAMLATYIEKDEAQVRLVSVQYAGEVFPSCHLATRYILLLGAGDKKEEVVNNACAHLYRALNKAIALEKDLTSKSEAKNGFEQESRLLPKFFEMLKYVLNKASIRVKSQQKFVIGGTTLAFEPNIYVEILNFLRMCLMHDSGFLPRRESLSNPQESAPMVNKYLAKAVHEDSQLKNSIFEFLDFTELIIRASQGAAQAQCLLQILGCFSDQAAERFQKKLGWIKGMLNNTREDIRELVAQIYSIVASACPKDSFERAVTDLTKVFKDKQLEFQTGCIMAMGFSLARYFLFEKMKNKGKDTVMTVSCFKEITELILEQLNHSHQLMLGSACLAIGEIGRCTKLPLEDSGKEDNIANKLAVVKKLLALMKSGKSSMKVRERAALAVGQLCIGDASFPHRDIVIKGFLEAIQEIKEVELHLTMGEALVYAVLGPLSPMGRDLWTIDEQEFKPVYDVEISDSYMAGVLEDLMGKYMISTHPNVKQGSCIFLLALLQHGKTHIKVKDKLTAIQSSFMSLLGDNNDMVQDTASKGLGVVYEACSEDQRDEMVGGLLQTLLEGNRKVQQVTGDTKLFEEGQLGKMPTSSGGGNLTTYKELCSLASDLNQPELVYKFMNLANHNAMWNSRRGAAFGFGTIAAKAGEQLEPHLPKIIPKLYRYQFDPTPKVQQSMQSIWNSLVSEPTKTVDKYLREILKELLHNLTSNQWRVRESCCFALQDVLRGRTLEDALDVLPQIWSDLFRVMDDIKESVRIAAAKTVSALSRTTIKMCDVAQAGQKSGEATITAVMPTLLEKGLLSTVGDVRSAALAVIMKVTKSAGSLLKPHLSILIPALLEATSELEGTEIGYLSSRLANDPSVQEKLDLARISAAKSSPMMECVNFVIQYVDASSLMGLVPRLVDLIKTSIGLGTKGAAAHVVTALTHQCPLELEQYTGKILAAFFTGLSDRNPAVRKTYASAIGQVIKTAKDRSVEKLFVKLRSWYMEKDDDAARWAVAYTFQAITLHNPDKMKSNAAQALPIAFLAMHEEKTENNKDSLEVWEEVWNEGTPGTEGGIRLYLTEIVALLSAAIESPKWTIKAEAARAMGTIAIKLENAIPPNEQKHLLALLLNGLAGRTWTGKEALLTALADVCKSGSSSVKELLSDESMDESVKNMDESTIVKCLFKECQKEKLEYKIVAIECTGIIFKALQISKFSELFEIVFPIIKQNPVDEDNDDSKMLVDEESKPSLELQYAAIKCLGLAWPSNDSATQQKHILELMESLNILVQATTRHNQICITYCLGEIVTRWKLEPDKEEFNANVIAEIAKLLSAVLVIPKSSQLRSEALNVLGKVVKLLISETCKSNPRMVYIFRDEVAKSLDYVIKDLGSDHASKDTARELKTSLMEISFASN